MIESDKHKTAVVFRKWGKRHGGGAIALFPEIPCGRCPFYCLTFEMVVKFGGADYDAVIASTVPATEEEFAEMRKELERLGYNLATYQRRTTRMREKFRGRIS